MSVSIEIKKHLTEKKVSQQELADAIGMSRNGLQKSLSRETLRINVYIKICKYFNVPIDFFVSEEELKGYASDETMQTIIKHLKIHNQGYLCFLMIEYYSLLRPNEILGLKISDIDLENSVITVKAEVSKNGKIRIATIPDVMKELIIGLCLHKYPKNMYVFSDKLLPGNKRQTVKYCGRIWIALRKTLKLKKEYQMYSLRDMGIINLLQSGISPEEVAKQADHYSLEITSRYAIHANKKANEQVKNLKNNFKI
jgi:integrase